METKTQIAIFSSDSNQPIFLDKSAIEYSNLLKSFFESRKEYAPENIKINLAYEDLKNSLDIINLFLQSKKDSSKEPFFLDTLQETTLQNLINSYYIADYFMINEIKEYLGSLFNKPEFIEQLAQLDKEQLQTLEFIKTKDFLPDQAPKPLLENVSYVYWPLDGSRYFTVFTDGTRQLFDKDGNSIGSILRNVSYIYWSPDGSCYLACFTDGTNQLFDKDGNSIGNNILRDIDHIDWSPDSSRYLVSFINGARQLFDKNGNSIENNILRRNVYSISWSPDGSRYLASSTNGTRQLFDKDGNSIVSELRNIDSISWSPDSSCYLARFTDGTRQLFDKDGNSIENNILRRNIDHIDWSPDGSRYLASFTGGINQLFDKYGNSIGGELRNIGSIYWSPDSSRYILKFTYDSRRQLFDKDGNSIGSILRNVSYMDWSPDGSCYLACFTGGTRQLFDKNGNLILDITNKISKLYLYPGNTLLLIDSQNNLYQNKLEFLVKKVADGYQIYRAKDELPVGAPLQNKPLWIDTNSFKIEEDDDQEQYYSYKELALPDLVTKAAVSGDAFREAWKATS